MVITAITAIRRYGAMTKWGSVPPDTLTLLRPMAVTRVTDGDVPNEVLLLAACPCDELIRTTGT